MHRIVIPFVLALGAFGCEALPVESTAHSLQCAPPTGVTDYQFEYINSSGVVELYDYRVYIPTTYSCAVQSPMVMMFHGGGQELDDFTNSLFSLQLALIEAEANNAVLVAVDSGIDNGWSIEVVPWTGTVPEPEHKEMVYDLVQHLAGTNATTGVLNIDRNQVHAMGFSHGGIFAQILAVEYANMFGAIAVIASISSIYDTACDPYSVGCIPTDFANVWGQTTALSTPTSTNVMLVRGSQDPVFLETGGWFQNDPATELWTLPSSGLPTTDYEYGLWTDSTACSIAPSVLLLNATGNVVVRRQRCTGGNGDVRLDVVDQMGHEMPTELSTDYDGPRSMMTYLLNHPR